MKINQPLPDSLAPASPDPAKTGKRRGKILLLEHLRSPLDQSQYVAQYVLQSWEKKGVQVLRHTDLSRLPEADTLFVHVDLSVLPLKYRNLAGGFSSAINSDVVDIRKRTLGLNQVSLGDGYDGPVIIKSNLNHAGWAERKKAAPQGGLSRFFDRLQNKKNVLWRKWAARLPGTPPVITSKGDYFILPSAKAVPARWFGDAGLVVERFTPEFHDGLYVLREWYFLGDAEFVRVETAPYPVITSGDNRPDLVQRVPDNLRRLRREWKIDFGKIDYVMKDGAAVVFDVNKTPSFSRSPESDSIRNLLDALSPGMASFLV